MSTHNRPERVAQEIQQLLGAIFARGLRDPRIGFVTITGCKLSPDLRDARVYWAVHGSAQVRKDTEKGLEAARGFLRREIASQLKLRVTPDLHFSYDEAIDRGDRIEQLLQQVKTEEKARAPEPAGAEPEAAGAEEPE